MEIGPLPVETHPTPADVQFLEDRLHEYNEAQTGMTDGQLLALFIRDAQHTIQAGLAGWTWGGCCYIRYLWVHADLRG
jgi:hypothetical protein